VQNELPALSEDEELHLLGHNAVQSIESLLAFHRNTPPPSPGSKNKPSMKPAGCYLLRTGFLLGLFFNPENEDMFL
jgi:hypothetical protein